MTFPSPIFDSVTVNTALTYTATGGTVARTAENRAADVANITDFDGGSLNDDALRFRNAIASGKQVIFVPPGIYTFKSRVVQPGPFFPDPPPCVLFVGLNDVTVFAYGATFLIDDTLSGTPPPAPYASSGTAHVGFMGDCHNIIWKGGRFQGNTTGSGSAVNAGMWFYCVTGILIQDTEWLGEWRNGPFNGVWMFDCTFRNNRTYGSGLCWDFAYVENLLLEGNRCEGGAGYDNNIGSCCFKLFADSNTYMFNTSGQTYAQVTWLSTGAVRQLRGTPYISNNVLLVANTFNKWITGIYLDGVDSVLICENTIRDGPFVAPTSASGITIITSPQTVTFGTITRDVFIHDNDIYSNGGPGVQMDPDATAGLGTIEIVGNRIYDNQCANAITFLFSTTFVGTFRLEDNDFNTRTSSGAQVAPYDPATMTAIAAIVQRNLGITPYDQTGAFSTIITTDNITIANNKALHLSDTVGSTPRLLVQGDNNMVLFGSDAGGADRPLLSIQQRSSTSEFQFRVPLSTNTGPLNVHSNMITTIMGGGAASNILSDGTSYAGSFMDGTGIGFGPASNLGVPTSTWAMVDGTNGFVLSVPLVINASGPTIRSGAGAASGTQPKGSIWMRTDGGVGTTMYVSQGGGTWNPVAGV